MPLSGGTIKGGLTLSGDENKVSLLTNVDTSFSQEYNTEVSQDSSGNGSTSVTSK